jgi:phosphoribosyl 1,2-cyclic phosphodiesterase
MMKVCVLASGSSGNAIWVGSSKGAVLFDAGISFRSIRKALEGLDEDVGGIQAVVLSHEHTDHIKGLSGVSRNLGVAVLANAGTARMISQLNGKMRFRPFECGKAFQVAGLEISTFPVLHDAIAPVGFVVEDGSSSLGICTDLGFATGLVKERLSNCQAVIVEANHDRRMLMEGPYPVWLKQRIQSQHGHLANHETAGLLSAINRSCLDHVYLAHLSQVNNTPERAEDCVAKVLDRDRTRLHLTWQDRASDKIEI